ncbi:MAG: glycerol-3-phosphate dehydrogenase/oxidase [Armatimonadota bacterium]|nr:glycerol-3-phosphate dehydrogenase/oxidase [Armatimonadota bacterium]
MSRQEALDALGRGVDVLVVGGGITGAGVALDAASRGYRVGLVERRDFASGTSSRSTRLVHGGIRYLPQGHVGLVREALRERRLLFRLAPHLVRPVGFVVPLYRGSRRPLGMRLPGWLEGCAPLGVRVALAAYDLFSRDPRLRHRVLAAAEVAELVPDLRTAGLRAAFLYWDGRTDDVRLTHAVLATARALGAWTVNYAEVVGFERAGGRIRAAGVVDRLTGRTLEVPARWVVNATGIWAERVAALDGHVPFRIRHSKGVHLVLAPDAVRARAALVIPETDDGRLAFLVPWGGRFVLGTTDTPYEADLDSPQVTPDEVAYLLEHASRYLRAPVGVQRATAAYAGIRPLVGRPDGSTATLSRDHLVVVSPGGLVTVAGGKLTTYRQMAQDAVDALVRLEGRWRPCRTHTIPLVGAEMPEAAAELDRSGLEDDQRQHLLFAYGGLVAAILRLAREDPRLGSRLASGLPHIAAEVVYACRSEYALSLVDCLYLRTRLAVLDTEAADRAAPSVANLMARELGWSPGEVARQLEEYRARRAREEAWRPSRPGGAAAQASPPPGR